MRKGAALVVLAGAGALGAVACVDPPIAEPALKAPLIAFKDRRMAEFSPEFAGKPFDLKCGDCSWRLLIDACSDLGRIPVIVRATVTSQEVMADRCDQRTEHDPAFSCMADVTANLKDVEILRASAATDSIGRVATRFFYENHGEPKRTEFLKPGSYFFFLYRNPASQRVDNTWMAEAVCPVLTQ
jgi:hypothetical protein